MDQNRGRVDIMCDNYGGGYFKELPDKYSADSIPIECKNYRGDLGNDEFNQLADRLSPETGLLGFLFCRHIKKREQISMHVSEYL